MNPTQLLSELGEMYRNLPLEDRLNVKRFINHDLGEITFALALAELNQATQATLDNLKALRGAK